MFRFDFSRYNGYDYFIVGANWNYALPETIFYLMQRAACFDMYTLPHEELVTCIAQFRTELTDHITQIRPTQDDLRASGFQLEDEAPIEPDPGIPDVFAEFIKQLERGDG